MRIEMSSIWLWLRRSLIAVGSLAAVSSAAVYMQGAGSTDDLGPKIVHTVGRGDLEVTVIEQGTLESSENTEIKCKVRGQNTVTFVVESGTYVETGDVLLRLDTLFIEEQINERSKYAHWSRSAAERSKADVARSELAIKEYLDGRFVSRLATMEKDLAT